MVLATSGVVVAPEDQLFLPGNRADRGCVTSGGQHHLAGNGADFPLVLKLENQMAWAATPDELRPVTIDDVISPVPMNPSCMSLSCRFQSEGAHMSRQRLRWRGPSRPPGGATAYREPCAWCLTR